MNWLDAATGLREQRRPGILVTLVDVRGHAPRAAGAKMVVAATEAWGTIGGGNLEATAISRARDLLADGAFTPTMIHQDLTEHAAGEFGRQCCGGSSTVLLEPLPVPASVAIFGLGHVGRELARLLSRHDLDLHLVDGRPGFAVPSALPALDDALAHIRWHEGPWPDPVLAHLPGGTHVLVMTHDHAEDAALCDAALRAPVRSRPASVGLIGSRTKWRRIEKALRELGHPPESTARITCPIGDPGVPGKDPASIALSVAVDLLRRIAEPPTVPDPRGLPLRHGDRP